MKGAIFDVDGTILDSMQMWINFGHDFLTLKGIVPPDDIDDIIQYFSLRETAEYFSSRFALGDADDIEKEIMQVTEDFYFNKAPLKPGVKKLITDLYNCGIKLYVATATYEALIRPALQRVGVLSFFEGVVTCSEVGYGKDCPDVFLAAQQVLGTDIKDTWVFEDALHAVKTAKSAGFLVCGIYDPTEKENKGILKDLCDIYIESFESLSVSDFR